MSSNNDKERFGDLCKQHAGRGEKDLSRVCPSKLSKRELEDLYYSLLDNNLELKRAVNGQNEKIRLLTTKVNRMTAQNKTYLPRDQKDCCAGAKAIITDQKASIADLKKANECMSERIKRLNMRLCSAKQFLKKSPSQTINKCYKCFSGASTQKNQSTSALNNKGSDMDLKNKAQETPDRDSPKKLNVETNTIEWEHLIQNLKNEKSCDENKCRSTMDELKRKIVDLQEELSNSRKDNTKRMNQLEEQVARLQALAQRHTDRALRRDRDAAQAEGEKEQLEMQLTTEKMKVAELETRLKSADMSKEVATAIEKHLSHAKKLEASRELRPSGKRCVCSACPRLAHSDAPTANTQTESRISNMFNLIRPTTYEDKQTTSDDSGYAEQNQDSQKEGVFSKINEEIVNKVAYLQEQLNFIKSALVGTPASEKPSRSTFDSYETDVKDFDVPILKNVKDYTCVIVDPKSDAIIEITHVNKNTTDDEDDEEMIDSDIEGNYNDNVKTKDHQSMTSVKPIGESRPPNTPLEADRLNDGKEIVTSEENGNLDNIRRKGSTISLPESVKQEPASNDSVKSRKDDENLQKIIMENETKAEDYIVEPQLKKIDAVKCNKHVVCECPACEVEGANNKETRPSRVQSRDIFDNKVRPSNSEDEILLKTKTKADTHNSLQIPGPLPISKTDSANNKKTHNRVNKNIKKNTKDDSANVGNPEEKKELSGPIGEVNGDDVKTSTTYGRDVDATSSRIGDSENVSTVGKNIPEKEKTAQIKPEVNENVAKLIEIDENKLPFSRRTGSIIPLENERKPVNDRISVPATQPQKDANGAVRKSRTVKEEIKRLNEKAVESVPCHRGKNNLLEMDNAICARNPCLCPDDLPPTKRCCKCPTVATPNAGFIDPEPRPADPEKPRPSSAGHTYTLSSEDKSRATSPDNTENEISFMSDLPTEKEGTSRRSSLSPGEHKMTTTYQDSYTPCQWSSLSEGEVPYSTKTKKKLSISVGEHPGDEHSTVNPHFPEAAAEKMEAALRSISRELARCRAMLHQRPREPSKLSKDAETLSMELNREETHVLRRTRAAPCIGGIGAPKCVFVLHIGTIVLSDEAVINSRGTPLMLTWQFFEQSAAMARMSPGRVVHFDFSAEYEVNLTEEFVEYMKHVEMPIKICEMDDMESLFAMCSLPLREALLNVNRRVDLSLELVSSHPTSRRAHDSLDTSDEIGVLDLWCALRTESRNLPALQRAYGLNSAPSINDQPNKLDDAQSYSSAISQDLDLDLNLLTKQKMESALEHDKMLLNKRKSDKMQQKDFYVPEMSDTMPPVNELMPRHQKLSSPTVTSSLRLNTLETPTIPHIGEPLSDFQKKYELRRSVNSGMDDYMLRDGSSHMDNWRTMGSQRTLSEMKQNRALSNPEESLSRKKRRDSGGADATVKILKSSKELESEMMSTNRLKDSSTQSMDGTKRVTIVPNYGYRLTKASIAKTEDKVIGITVLWLALNEECDAMLNPNVRRLYVAYSFLGRDGAELETPVSLPKPTCYIEKCFFNFKKTFHLTEFDMPIIEHMATCRSTNRKTHNSKDCIVFSVVSEPPEDPLGLENCEDIGYAYLYLGDLLAYGAGDTFTQVLPVSEASGRGVCGVLAVRLDGLNVLRARTAR